MVCIALSPVVPALKVNIKDTATVMVTSSVHQGFDSLLTRQVELRESYAVQPNIQSKVPRCIFASKNISVDSIVDGYVLQSNTLESLPSGLT